MDSRTVTPSSVRGEAVIPASKSQTVRALLIASAAEGTSVITNPLVSGDTLSCLEACRSLGARIITEKGRWIVTGITVPKNPPSAPLVIDVGNSGTTLYLALGLAARLERPVIFTGDQQIRSRPASPLVQSLRDLGAECSLPAGPEMISSLGLAPPLSSESVPCMITGPLKGGRTVISCPTSQYLSGLLLSCPLAQNECIIEVPLLHERPYAEMTLQWLDEQGIIYSRDRWSRFVIPGNQRYRSFEKTVPGDYSSASFFFCAAALTSSRLTVTGTARNDSQGDREILACLEQMGCTVEWKGPLSLEITGPPKGSLQGREFDLNSMPDTLPVLAVTAAYAQGTTVLGNVPQARIKETDRIDVMCRELRSLGAEAEQREDALVIHGNGRGLSGGHVRGHGDHRVIMALAVGALAARSPVTIDDVKAAEITFPGFFSILESITQGAPR